MLKMFASFCRSEDGAAMAEYGLLVALIAVVVIAAVTGLGTTISTKFTDIATALAG